MARTKTTVRCLLLTMLAILIAAAGCSRVPEGDPENGPRWYKLYRCVGCHGENGTGGRGPVIADLSLSYGKFLNTLRSPNSAIMPAYGEDRLPDKDAAEIYLWLRQQKKGSI